MTKVSIIIPIYNVEAYLDQTISSVVSQSLHEIEIILVDDGSKDRSSQIVDDWASRDYRIVPIHKQNSGVIEARKTGLVAAKGEYVFYLDGDDYILPNCLYTLYESAKYNHADWVVSDFLIEYPDGRKNEKKFTNFGVVDNVGFLAYSYGNGDFYFTGRLIRRSLLVDSQINIPKEITFGEDNMIVTQLGDQLQCACKVNCVSLVYVQRGNSVTNKNLKKDLSQRARACRLCYDFLVSKQYFRQIKLEIDSYFCFEYLSCIARGYVDYQMSFVHSHCSDGKSKLPPGCRMFFLISRISPLFSVYMYSMLRKIKNKIL